MKKFYSVYFTNEPSGLGLTEVHPESAYVEDLFYNCVLTRDVHLGDCGDFRLDFWLDDEDGEIQLIAKFKDRGWCEVEI